MANGYKLWATCSLCKGTGITGDEMNPDVKCPLCKGKKYVFMGWCSEGVFALPSDLPEEP